MKEKNEEGYKGEEEEEEEERFQVRAPQDQNIRCKRANGAPVSRCATLLECEMRHYTKAGDSS